MAGVSVDDHSISHARIRCDTVTEVSYSGMNRHVAILSTVQFVV